MAPVNHGSTLLDDIFPDFSISRHLYLRQSAEALVKRGTKPMPFRNALSLLCRTSCALYQTSRHSGTAEDPYTAILVGPSITNCLRHVRQCFLVRTQLISTTHLRKRSKNNRHYGNPPLVMTCTCHLLRSISTWRSVDLTSPECFWKVSSLPAQSQPYASMKDIFVLSWLGRTGT
ncbi:hypothetical protein BDZ97DRAFT_1818386 [Flammula alnicola]|nr:hypothetical protein BDZ97DRAFT_1818386 [Flammula alnicola]